MTREEFNKEMEEPSLRQQRKNWLSFKSEKVQKELEHYEVPFKDYATIRQAFDMINEIHDDFESRTCENCKYYDRDGLCNGGWYMTNDVYSSDSIVPNPELYTKEDFGCNKFEPKEQK